MKLLVIYDVHHDCDKGRLLWAYGRRAHALQKYAPADFDVEICAFKDIPWERLKAFDLIFSLEYQCVPRSKFKGHAPNVPLVVSFNSDGNRRREHYPTCRAAADWIIFNNRHAFEYYGKPSRSCCISNGIDTDIFFPSTPIAEREQRIFWRGSSGPNKGKNWQTILAPAIHPLAELGFIPDFQPVNDIVPEQVLNTEDLCDLYNRCSYAVCASVSEGTPNFLLESAACSCVPVTTPVGNVLEFGRDGENCVIVDWSVDSLVQGLVKAREKREALSAAAAETMRSWAYGAPGNRAEYFFALFRALIAGRSPQPFSFLEITPGQI